MDITEVVLQGIPTDMLDEQELRRRYQRYGLINSVGVNAGEHSAILNFRNPISAFRFSHQEKGPLEEAGITIVYDKPEPQKAAPAPAAPQQSAAVIYRPYTYRKARKQQAKQAWSLETVLQNRKLTAVLVVAIVVALLLLRSTIYLPLKNRMYPSRRKQKRPTPNKTKKPKVPPPKRRK